MYAAEKPSSKELSSDSDADDFKESSRHPSNAKRCRLSKTTTDDTECESPSGNTRSRGKTPFLKSPENVVAISKTKVLSKYFKPAQEEENGVTHIQIAKTKTSKLSVAEEEKVNKK
ncbi:Recombination protein RecR [Orchesella cincta]|uniref:Recombination protein RecR n=1 Tax=Orchesella cincta TaxID=48709 RepID=A0A1D2MKI6_ORCCI|nr:Recombination protein RecR [Orchesella cincta]